MAEAAVSKLLDMFTPFVLEEVNLLSGVRGEIQSIRDEFELMKAFLQVADEKEESDPQLKAWVKLVRETAYDTSDALDMFMLSLGHRSRHGNRFYVYIKRVYRCTKTLKARHQIASEVKSIKARVTNISLGYQRYREIYDRTEQGSRSTISNNSWHDWRSDALRLPEEDLVGIHNPKSEMMEWLVLDKDPRLKVHSVAGMGGLGKTTLAKKVYDSKTMETHFQIRAWITVSQSFKIEELLKDMLNQLFEEVKQPLPSKVDTMNTDGLKGMIYDFLQQEQHKRYLVVLDDVWSIDAWLGLKSIFPKCNCCSRILLTTRDFEVAKYASNAYAGTVYNLQPLSPKDSWDLFCKRAFQGQQCPSDLEHLSENILKRCEGLPLAIVAISGLLLTKEKIQVEWDRIYLSLGAELDDKLKSVNKIMSLSYFDLPYHLKLCFLYLSIFPEDYFFDHWRLIRLWTAEGFVEVKERMTKEEVAEGYINELISRSLVQVAELRKDGRVKSYRIHDLWREIVISKSREQNIVSIASAEKARRLSIHNNTELEDIQSSCFTRLRSLVVFSAVDPSFMLSKVVSLGNGVKLLTMLDLRGTQLQTFPNEIVKLVSLTYLSLRGTKVKTIPKSIGNLKNLETLDLKLTDVTELPDEILKLQHLRHLLLYRYIYDNEGYDHFHGDAGFKALVGIGSLLSLQKLCSIQANLGSSNRILFSELGRLTQLRKLCILSLRKEDGKGLCSSLDQLNHLESLYAMSIDEDEILDLDYSLSLPPRRLRTLALGGCLHSLPKWIPLLQNLKHVSLRWSKLRDVDPVQCLEDLPYLVRFNLYSAYEGDKLCFKAGRFQRLKYLYLGRLDGLRWVRMEEGSMPLLEKLRVLNCKLMTKLPLGVEYLTNLKELALSDMPNSLISSLDRNLQGGDYGRIAHVPKVWIGDFKSGTWEYRYL